MILLPTNLQFRDAKEIGIGSGARPAAIFSFRIFYCVDTAEGIDRAARFFSLT
jgi:hypothetical protein